MLSKEIYKLARTYDGFSLDELEKIVKSNALLKALQNIFQSSNFRRKDKFTFVFSSGEELEVFP